MTANLAMQFLHTDNDAQLIANANRILKAMAGNPNFSSPLPQLPVVSDAVSTFATAMADAAAGHPAMNTAKNAARGLLVRLLRQLAGYVQAIGKGDMPLLLGSGFSIENSAGHLIDALPAPSNLTAPIGYRRRELYASETMAFSAH